MLAFFIGLAVLIIIGVIITLINLSSMASIAEEKMQALREPWGESK